MFRLCNLVWMRGCGIHYMRCHVTKTAQTTRTSSSFIEVGLPFVSVFTVLFAVACSASLSFGQELSAATASDSVSVAPQTPTLPEAFPAESKRIFGFIPNYRTWPSRTNYKPLSAKEKFEIARQDSFDRGTVALAAVFAADAQLTNANPSFGEGAKGYAHNFGTSYGDFVIGNYLSEAVFPTLLHQDPRYFRRGIGSGASRLGYAVGQIFWTHTDSDRTQFNYSEILGNSTAVAISNAYYPDQRSVSDSAMKLGMQLGVDMASNVLKEFWPDVSRKFRKHRQQVAGN